MCALNLTMDDNLLRLLQQLTGAKGLHGTEESTQQLVELLLLLNLIELENDIVRPTGEVSSMFLQSLAAHLKSGFPVGLDWNDLDSESLRGVDILRAVETARIQSLTDPPPARIVSVVQAIIKTSIDGVDHYFMQYDYKARRYQPVGGKVDPEDKDAVAALCREIFEELELSSIPTGSDLTLELIKEGWHEQTISATYGILTSYTFSFFHITDIWSFSLRQNNINQWLPQAEIAAGYAADGRDITPIFNVGVGWGVLNTLPYTRLHTEF